MREMEEKVKVSTLLMSMGILPSMAGFKYIKGTAMMYERYKGCMKDICEELGREYKTNGAAVEKDMRSAIGIALRRGWLKKMNEIMGVEYLSEGYKPTNKEFIATLLEMLKLLGDDVVLKRY